MTSEKKPKTLDASVERSWPRWPHARRRSDGSQGQTPDQRFSRGRIRVGRASAHVLSREGAVEQTDIHRSTNAGLQSFVAGRPRPCANLCAFQNFHVLPPGAPHLWCALPSTPPHPTPSHASPSTQLHSILSPSNPIPLHPHAISSQPTPLHLTSLHPPAPRPPHPAPLHLTRSPRPSPRLCPLSRCRPLRLLSTISLCDRPHLALLTRPSFLGAAIRMWRTDGALRRTFHSQSRHTGEREVWKRAADGIEIGSGCVRAGQATTQCNQCNTIHLGSTRRNATNATQ